MKKTNWVDIKRVKHLIDMNQVIGHYGFKLKAGRGGELSGHCPFHDDKKPSFRVNTEKGVFNCFGCSAKGNVLDLIRLKEDVSIRKAAVLAAEWFDIDASGEANQTPRTKAESAPEERKETSRDSSRHENGANGNQPLTFRLKLDADHPYLRQRGVDEELAKSFDVGFCSRGILKGRIAIGIHNGEGELVAYAGRWPEETVPESGIKYKLPPGFKKNLVLYNLHRVVNQKHLVVVEGFWSVIRLHKLGIPAVALIGRTLSEAQEELLASRGVERLTVLMDGDAPGKEAQAELALRLGKRFFVKSAWLPDGTEPDTIEEQTLTALLGIKQPHKKEEE